MNTKSAKHTSRTPPQFMQEPNYIEAPVPNPMLKHRSALITIVTICAIIGATVAVVAYGRGYRIDLKKNSLKPTGLISATSDPIAAQVFVDGSLKTATNNSFAVDPGFYTVRISKEGYIPWEKKMRVQGEVVSRAEAFLFPTNPSLSPLTTLGIEHATLSPDGTRVAYTIPNKHIDPQSDKKAGLWVYELSEGPLGRNRDPIQLGADDGFDFENSDIVWSPNVTQILVQNPLDARLYTLSKAGTFTNVTFTRELLFSDWNIQRTDTEKQKLAAFKQPIVDIATTSARIISFSPDETKILYEATASATIPTIIKPPLIGTNYTQEDRDIKPNKIYVYDSKEDKNYFLLDDKELPATTPAPRAKTAIPTPTPIISGSFTTPLHWFPTSKHILMTSKGKIDVMEYDRTNWITIYSGPFVDNFVAPWNNGSRIIILTNLNGDATSLPNLYTVNLR